MQEIMFRQRILRQHPPMARTAWRWKQDLDQSRLHGLQLQRPTEIRPKEAMILPVTEFTVRRISRLVRGIWWPIFQKQTRRFRTASLNMSMRICRRALDITM